MRGEVSWVMLGGTTAVLQDSGAQALPTSFQAWVVAASMYGLLHCFRRSHGIAAVFF